MAAPLDRIEGIRLKLLRAEKHLADIDSRGMAWVTKKESWRFATEINEGERRYIVSMGLAKPPPPILAIKVDEVVHHLRSALDHLASYLVEWSGGQEGRAAWPVTKSRHEWERRVAKRERWFEVWRKERGGPLAGASPEVRAFIEGSQPYRRTSDARQDALFTLNDLWNAEKHRVLNPIRVVGSNDFGTWSDLFHATPEIAPARFKWLARPRDEFKLGAEIKLAVLEFPVSGPLPKVKMDGQIPVQVLVGDGEGDGSLADDLVLIRGIVDEALGLFPPKSG